MNLTLLFFLLLLGVSCSFYTPHRWYNKIYWIIAAMLSVVIGLRDFSVQDTENYAALYSGITAFDLSSISLFSFEPGFQYYTHFLKKIAGGNLNGYFFLLALTNYVFIYFALNNWGKWHTPDNKKLNSVLFLVLYSSFFGMFYNAIVVRAGLALSILLLATSLLSKSQLNYKDLFFAGCFFVVALSFHYSSFLGIVACVIYRIGGRKSSKIYIIIWNLLFLIFILRLSPYVVYILLGGIISVFGMFDGTDLAKYSYYLDELYKLTYAIPYRGVFYFVIGWFFIHYKTNNILYYKALNVYLVGLLGTALFYSIEQISRITDYFLIYSIFLLYILFERYLDRKSGALLYLCTVTIQFVFFIRIIYDA